MTDDGPSSESELARLADGSLPAAQLAQLRARVSQSSELAAELADQERVVSLLRAIDQPAPAALRARVGRMTDGAAAPARPPRLRSPRLTLALGAALIVAVAGLIVGLTRGGSLSPDVPQVARLALASSTMPAPAEDPAHPGLLVRAVDGVRFPYWERSVGWRAVGQRTDTLRGREVITVFYVNHFGTRVGYAIVAGPALPQRGGQVIERGGVRFSVLQQGSLRILTWRRAGHTCVLAGPGVSNPALLRLVNV